MSSVHDRRPSVHCILGSARPAKPSHPFGAGLEPFELFNPPSAYEDEAPTLSDAEMADDRDIPGWPDDSDTAYWERRCRFEDEQERIALELASEAPRPFEPDPTDRSVWAELLSLAPISGGSPDDLPTLSQDDKDRIEDEVMGHLEDLDARREWRPEGGGR